jgi:hypothetical protein
MDPTRRGGHGPRARRLAHDGHAHAVELLDSYRQETADADVAGRFVDVASPTVMAAASQKTA